MFAKAAEIRPHGCPKARDRMAVQKLGGYIHKRLSEAKIGNKSVDSAGVQQLETVRLIEKYC